MAVHCASPFFLSLGIRMTTTETKLAETTTSKKGKMMKAARIKNIGSGVLWLNQSGNLQMMMPDSKKIFMPASMGGAVVRDDGELTEEQWKSRSPENWGIMAANGMVDVLVFPSDEEEAIYNKAKETEEQRLEKKRLQDAEESKRAEGKI